MSSQIFKTSPSLDLFIAFIKSNGEFRKNQYIFSKSSFKKARLNKMVNPFFLKLKEHYYGSKKYYVERKITYKSLVTVIRQGCKFFDMPFTSSIKYDKSKYTMEYYIIIPEPPPDVLL